MTPIIDAEHELAWATKHWPDLVKRYNGMWIAIKGKSVIASGFTYAEAVRPDTTILWVEDDLIDLPLFGDL